MTLNQRFSVVALLLLGCSAQAQSDARLLDAIGQVETGMDRNAIGKAGERGAYQMGRDAWQEGTNLLKVEGHYYFSWGRWRDATAQDMTASAFLRVIRRRFANVGIPNPTPEQIAVVWNMGWTVASKRRFIPNGYAERVGNLFRLSQTVR
jgi:hypothetical protein